MPRGKKASSAPVNTVVCETVSSAGETKATDLRAFLFKLRDLCRNKGAQMDENGNIYADLIYDDLLFLKNAWRLAESGMLTIDVSAIIDGFDIKGIRLESIASLAKGDQTHVGTVFRRLWTQLQRSNLKDIFDRDFALMGMLKDEKLKSHYLPLLTALLDYVGTVQLATHEDTDPYEYFTQDLKKSKSKYFGQFYTPQSVTDSCVNEIAPKFGEIGLDPMAGTSKFMRSAATYIHRHEPAHSEWDAFQYMRTVEIESKIYRQGILGSFIKYNQLPNLTHIRKGNAFDLLPKEAEKVDYILGNPPYGGTVDGFEDLYYDTELWTQGKRTKSRKVVKAEIVHPFPFVKKDTSVLALQLIVNKLKDGGRAAVVFNGTIMNDSHRDVMKWFLDCCDLRKVIVNPSGTFQCTGIETYSLIFWKGTPTTRVEYVEFGTGKVLGAFTRAELEEREYDIKPFFSNKNTNNTNYINTPLGKLIELQKSKIQASKQVPGDYLFVSTGNGTHNEYLLDEGEHVFISDLTPGSGIPKVKFVTQKCSYSTLLFYCKLISPTLNPKFLYYYLHLNPVWFRTFYSGISGAKLNKSYFLSATIPLPPRDIQEAIVATLDRIYNPGTTDLTDTLKLTSQAMDLVLADSSGTTLTPVVEAQRLIRKSAQMVADVKAQMAAIMKSVGSRGFEKKALKDVMNLVGGKGNQHRSSDLPIPYYESNGVYGYVAEPLYTGEYTITARCMSIGSVHYVNGPFYPSDHTVNFTSKDTTVVNNRFFYYWLLLNNNLLKDLSSGIKPGIRKSDVAEIKMPVPPLDFQMAVLARLEALQTQLTALETLQRQSEDNARFILESYLGAPATENADTAEVADADSESGDSTIEHV